MTPKNKPKVLVFRNNEERLQESQDLPDDTEAIVRGSNFYGERYEEAALSFFAKNELAAAVRLVAWYTQFQCRFSEEPKAITELLNYDKRKN